MTQTETYKGKLGFEGRAATALSVGAARVVGALEEFGHSVKTFSARSGSRVIVDCELYRVELRFRRQPKRGWKAPQSEGDTLKVVLSPHIAQVCDREIAEMTLALLIHRLVESMDVVSVKWQDWSPVLTRAQFLSVFETVSVDSFSTSQDARIQDIVVPNRPPQDSIMKGEILPPDYEFSTQTPVPPFVAAQERAELLRYSQAAFAAEPSIFGSIDEMAQDLEAQYDEIYEAAMEQEDSIYPPDVPEAPVAMQEQTESRVPQHLATWSLTAAMATISLPMAGVSALINIMRASNLRISFHMLLLLAATIYLDSTGMVSATLNLLP